MRLLKTVFHVHTDFSDDSNNAVEHLLDCAHRWGIDCLAVTDHDTIEGAQALAAAAGPRPRVIVGEEISTHDGHLIGLFLNEHVGPGRSARETAKAIRQQGGLVVVPHPFNSIFGCGLRSTTHDLLDLIDAVEVANAQNFSPLPNRRARQFAHRHHLPALVGVDSHHRHSVHTCYQHIPEFDGPESFLAALRHAQLVPGRHTLGYFARSAWLLARYHLGLGTPADYGRRCPMARPKHHARSLPVPIEP
ncbi:MAG: PHP domain-containing protein [Phycisphaerae bacterium]|nr:PHP domain-containing protein [Phycisphaerae bacterium]